MSFLNDLLIHLFWLDKYFMHFLLAVLFGSDVLIMFCIICVGWILVNTNINVQFYSAYVYLNESRM